MTSYERYALLPLSSGLFYAGRRLVSARRASKLRKRGELLRLAGWTSAGAAMYVWHGRTGVTA